MENLIASPTAQMNTKIANSRPERAEKSLNVMTCLSFKDLLPLWNDAAGEIFR
jgi:hypothetical protein